MGRYKVGITEAGDAGVDLSWIDKIREVDGVILVTKDVSGEQFQTAVLHNKEKIILQATVTGYGGTIVEPNVITKEDQLTSLNTLVWKGFPKEQIVVRVDPIIPTAKGLIVAKNTIQMFAEHGYTRFRISVIDMYPHVRRRFANAGLPLVYGGGFSPSKNQLNMVDKMLQEVNKQYDTISIEACAEPGLSIPLQIGCISSKDLQLIGLTSDIENEGIGFQREGCMCYGGKTELLKNRKQCVHKCLYCYWK